tara:strand:+ start:610 stop:1011 length:402 start_codon:yes stop_codon:yes gene_type:complete
MKFIELTEEQIKQVEKDSVGEPYPVLAKNLHSIGIDNYVVNVGTGETNYTSTTGETLILERTTEAFEPSDHFDLTAVKNAIKRTQNGESDYSTFLHEIGAAGVHTYVSDLKGMKLIYQGINSEYEYEELIPKI